MASELAGLKNAKKNKAAWTEELQKELDAATAYLKEVESAIAVKAAEDPAPEAEEEPKKAVETKPAEAEKKPVAEETKPAAEETKPAYVPAPGTETMVHLRIVQGKKFNPNTGEPMSKPYVQMFTYPEWTLFKQRYKVLGYSIEGVLHDPYGEAKEFVTEK